MKQRNAGSSFLFLSLLLLSVEAKAQSPDTSFRVYEQNIPGSSLRFRMVPIPAGQFTMGSPAGEKSRAADEGPQRVFSISPFWMGAFEVTHDEFDVFFKDDSVSRNSVTDAITRPSPQYVDLSWGMGRDGGYPVNSMQQKTALMYCYWLYKKTGIFYRLPTEAEWEYACRAGTQSRYFFGEDEQTLGKYAWYTGNSENKYHKVGEKSPNPWGLYDMLGNLAEWVLDQYDEHYFEKIADRSANPQLSPSERHPRSLRGGSYSDEAADLRCARRQSWLPEWNRRDPQIPKSKWWLTDAAFAGFRVVRPLQQPSPEEIEKFFTLYLSN